MKWISVKDRLPEVPKPYSNIKVLVCNYRAMKDSTREYNTDTAYYYWEDKRFRGGMLVNHMITHWIYLPELPANDDSTFPPLRPEPPKPELIS